MRRVMNSDRFYNAFKSEWTLSRRRTSLLLFRVVRVAFELSELLKVSHQCVEIFIAMIEKLYNFLE